MSARSAEETEHRLNTLALMAATIHAADRAACIDVWARGFDRELLTIEECAERAQDLFDSVERHQLPKVL